MLGQTYAQKPSTFENWFSAGTQVKTGDFTFSLEEGWRVREFYMSRQNYTDLNGSYKFSDFFQASAGYRLVFKTSMFNITEVNHRLYLDGTFNKEVNDIDLSLRTRYQYTSLGQEDDIDLPSESYWRNRFKAKFKVNDDISVSPAYEMFINIATGQTLLTENRLSIEAQYKFNKKNSLSVGFVHRNYIQVETPSMVNILSLDYVFKF